jgi:hypothetical protein
MQKYIYPEAAKWMWNYCYYLGPYKDQFGKLFDLGVYVNPDGKLSAAIVDGNEPGNYMSGELKEEADFYNDIYNETVKRSMMIRFNKTDFIEKE